MRNTTESIGKFIGRLIIVAAFYGIYKLIGFESTVIIILAVLFVNTDPDRKP